MYAFHKDIRDNMCDVCLISIAKKEEISLPFKYQCEVCHKKYETKTQFRQHKHCKFKDSSLTFICEICSKVWKEEEPFEKHMQQKHNKHLCVCCNAKLEGKENLDLHFRAKHRAF